MTNESTEKTFVIADQSRTEAQNRSSVPVVRPELSARSRAISSGRSRPTGRDRRVLARVGDHYGATYFTLGYWLADDGASFVSEAAVRQQVRRWVALGLVTKLTRLNNIWVTLTPRGYDFVGQKYVPWRAPTTRLVHTDTVAATRIWYESSPDRVAQHGRWICERQLLQQRGRFGPQEWHVADAELQLDPSNAVAIEVELTVKRPASRYVTEVLERLRPGVTAVIYMCPPAMVGALRRSVSHAQDKAELGSSVAVTVDALPKIAQRRAEAAHR